MASYAPGKCCFIGFKHEGEPQGEIRQFHGYNIYVATPNDNTEKGILLLPDFMGYEPVNAKLLADHFAANGFITLIPDIWEGDNVPLNWEPGNDFNLGQWTRRHPPNKVEPIIETAISILRDHYSVKKIGGAGYCLGAKYVCRFMSSGNGLDAGYIAHPSATTGDEVKGVAGPMTIAAAEHDDLFPAAKRRDTEEILNDSGNQFSIAVYSGVEHAFGLKADLTNASYKFVSETTFLQAVNWFNHFLKA